MTVAVPLVACSGGETGGSFAVRDSAGVQIVESFVPAWRDAWRVEAPALLEIGDLDDGDSQSLFRVTGAARLSDGRIVVANGGTHQLRIYGPDGRLLRSFGREGGGPREFRRLSGVWVLEGDSILAYDGGNDRFTVFEARGEFVRSFRLEPVIDPFIAPEGVLADGSILAAHVSPMTALTRPGVNVDTALILRFDRKGAFLDSLTRVPHNERVLFQSGNRVTVLGAPFARNASFAITADGFCFGTGAKYRVRCYAGDGTLRRMIRLAAYAPIPVTPEVIDAYIDTRTAEGPDAYRRVFLRWVREMPFPEDVPAYRDLLTDSEGNLWVREFGLPGDEAGTWRVFDPMGRWLGIVEMPPGFEPFQIGPGYLLGLWRDELDVEHIRIYRLRKPVR